MANLRRRSHQRNPSAVEHVSVAGDLQGEIEMLLADSSVIPRPFLTISTTTITARNVNPSVAVGDRRGRARKKHMAKNARYIAPPSKPWLNTTSQS